jgi:hypothetical protein
MIAMGTLLLAPGYSLSMPRLVDGFHMGRYYERMEREVLFLLYSATQALRAEASLRAAGVECVVIPVPRTLSAQCGVCLRVPAGDRMTAETILAESGTAVSAVHEVDGRPVKTAGPEVRHDG